MTQPEIRFNGFSDEWVEKKLGDVANLIQGAAWKSSEYLETGPNLLITISNLKNAMVDTSFGNRLGEVSADLQEKYGIANNDVLVSMTGNVGRVSIYKDYVGAPNALLNQRVGKIIPVNIDNLFLYAILRSELFERKMIDKGQGAAQLNISSKDIQQFPIQLPSLPEQQKIGALFSKYDTIIALREQKLEELNALKKGLLKRMFPKNGTKVPELRFAGFADDWVERRLGDITEIIMGQSPHSVNYTDNPQDHILVQGNADMKNGRVVPRVWTKEVTKMVDANYLILGVRAPVGVVGKTDYPVVVGRGVAAIKGNDFLYQYLQRLQEIGYWNRMSTGSTFDSINSQDVKDAKIQLPTLPEQQKIGQLFKQLDDRILNEQSKIEQLKAQKQGLLQRVL